MAPVFFGVPAMMYWTVDHKPQDQLEGDLKHKYRHLVGSDRNRKIANQKFKNICLNKEKEDTLDELMHRGNAFSRKIEFAGPRSKMNKSSGDD